MSDSGWTDKRFAFAKERYLAGHSASMIADALAIDGFVGVTRNSVVGKIFRHGVKKSQQRIAAELSAAGRVGGMTAVAWRQKKRSRPRPSPPPAILPMVRDDGMGNQATYPSAQKTGRANAQPAGDSDPGSVEVVAWDDGGVWSSSSSPDGGVRLIDARAHHCRWPIGDPRDVDGFRFCGEEVTAVGGPYCNHHRRLAVVSALKTCCCSGAGGRSASPPRCAN